MKIRVRGYLGFRKVVGDQPFREIGVEGFTIRDLIRRLSHELGNDFAHMVSDLGTEGATRHIAILVNGRHYSHLPDRLDTELTDGDEVAIFPPVSGG